MNTNNTGIKIDVTCMEKGEIYSIYEGVPPIKCSDKKKIAQAKEHFKFITKRAICKCGKLKESKRMSTPICYTCSKKESQKKSNIKARMENLKKKEETLKQHGTCGNGNSIWL